MDSGRHPHATAVVRAAGVLVCAALSWCAEPKRTPVRDSGLVANLFEPGGAAGKLPAVLIVGGSGGGIEWQDYMGDLLARRGFAALSLAYFGMEGLPKELELIPLEYFATALQYLRSHPAVDRERIGVVGVSKGGECALLIASRMPEIRAVVAFVPSSVVFQSIAQGWPRTSSWSWRGEPLPFVPYAPFLRAGSLTEMYRSSLGNKEAAERAAIQVENIRGPVLLLSGKADTLWPSTYMSEVVMARLRSHGFRYPYEHAAYDDAGHMISRIQAGVSARRGGTDEGNARAQQDAQKRAIEFLRKHLSAR